MKRSEVNQIIQDSLDFVEKQNKFLLPPFAHWTLKDWQTKGEECRDIIRQQLGWDITDFGSGDYRKIGLGIITIRNGVFEEATQGSGKSYAEKILLVGEEQITPTHFHYFKMEDIINRGGGDLVIQLWNSTPDEQLDETTPIVASQDGVRITVKAGGTIVLKPGDSVTLPTRLYHKFWGRKEPADSWWAKSAGSTMITSTTASTRRWAASPPSKKTSSRCTCFTTTTRSFAPSSVPPSSEPPRGLSRFLRRRKRCGVNRLGRRENGTVPLAL